MESPTPTSPTRGVPDKIPVLALKFNHDGRVGALNVVLSPTSTSLL